MSRYPTKTVTCCVCGHQYPVDANLKAKDEDWICRKSCLDKLQSREDGDK